MPRISLYGYWNVHKDMFDNIPLPEGCDRDLLIDRIMYYCGDLYPYYQSYNMMKHYIESWFGAMQFNFSKLFEAFSKEYNPIENYDRTEEYKRTNGESATLQENQNGTGNTENTLSAENSNVYQPSDKTDSKFQNNNESKENREGNENFTSRIHGNIGVTTNAQMITQESQLRKMNVYDIIVKMFEHEFMFQVY